MDLLSDIVVLRTLIIFFTTLILSQLRCKMIQLLIIAYFFICLIYEIIIGFCQISGIITTTNSVYVLTGSFDNPGPYGGYLAIIIIILGAIIIRNDFEVRNNKYYNWITIIILVLSGNMLVLSQSRSAILALISSALLFVIKTDYLREKIKPKIYKYRFIILPVVVVFITGAYLMKKPSADGRLFMDKICIKAIYDNNWNGAGHGQFGRAYGKIQANYFKAQIDEKGKDDMDWRAINEHDRMIADCPDNAFNEFLFIGVEEGMVAMLIFIIVIVAAIVVSFRRNTIWCYGLIAFAVFSMFSYPLHVKQFQFLLPILLALCISDKDLSDQDGKKTPNVFSYKDRKQLVRLTVKLMVLVVLSISILSRLPEMKQHKQAELEWKKAERWYKMGYYEYVVEDCDTLLTHMRYDCSFLFAYGQSLNKIGNYEKSDSVLKLGVEISSDPMFWNVMGNNSLAKGDFKEAEERYKHAFYMVPNRLYPLYLLGKLYHEERDTVRFLDMADRVESFIPKIESMNTERLRAEIRDMKSEYMTEMY